MIAANEVCPPTVIRDGLPTAPQPDGSRRPRGRRAVLVGLAAAAGVAAEAASAVPAAAAGPDPVLHLLRRATFGPTPGLVSEVRTKGATAWLAEQLNPTAIVDTAVDSMLTRWPRLRWKTWEVREKLPPTDRWGVMHDLVESHVARAVWSRRQLLEVVVDFWTNHLVVPAPTSDVWDNAHLFSRDVIRRYALGRYRDMLWASARHPAMLMILDNAQSTKKMPNENYGRELLELHTLGVGNFTESDVRNSALALTGLSTDSESGLYEYKPQRRYVGRLSVQGWTDPNTSAEAGEKVALSYLTYLARHPLTAKRIVTKLAVRFVSDAPPATLITKLVKVYTDNDTAIAPVLKALFTSAEFASSAGKKVRTPYQDALATIRILGLGMQRTGTTELRTLVWSLQGMGQAPMGWPAPDGYPDLAAAWSGASSTVARWNFHLGVAAGWSLKGMTRPPVRSLLPATPPSTYGAYVDALAARLLLSPLTAAQRTAVCTFLDKTPSTALRSTDAALGWRLPYVVALLLDSPNFTTR